MVCAYINFFSYGLANPPHRHLRVDQALMDIQRQTETVPRAVSKVGTVGMPQVQVVVPVAQEMAVGEQQVVVVMVAVAVTPAGEAHPGVVEVDIPCTIHL